MKRADLITVSSLLVMAAGALLWWSDPYSAGPLDPTWFGAALVVVGAVGLIFGIVAGVRSGPSGPRDPAE